MQQQETPGTVGNIPGQQQLQPTTNVQYVIAPQPRTQSQLSLCPNFPKTTALGVGITLIVAGLLSIVFNIVEIAVAKDKDERNSDYLHNYYVDWLYGYIGHGFWVGVMSIIAGGMGIGAGVQKTRSRICAFNALCVLAASFAAFQFGIGLSGVIDGPSCSYYPFRNHDCPGLQDTAIAMEALLTVLGVTEIIAAIWGSAVCCRTYCCCSCCEERTQSATATVMPYGTPITVIAGNQQIATTQYPTGTIQGYQHVAYQPGYPGQPIQFTAMPATYQIQSQFVPAGQPPNYPGFTQNAPWNASAMADVHTNSTTIAQLQNAANVHQQQQQRAMPPPQYVAQHHDSNKTN